MPLEPKQTAIDWTEARKLFETTSIGIKPLARRYGVDPASVRRHMQAEQWARPASDAPEPGEKPKSSDKVVRFKRGARAALGKVGSAHGGVDLVRPFTIDEHDDNHVQLAASAVALTTAMMRKVLTRTVLSPEDVLSIEIGRDLVQTARNAVLLDREVKGLKTGDASVPPEKSNEEPGKAYRVAVFTEDGHEVLPPAESA